uniref:Structural maintenance of chromosomes 6 n=1 Tax=Scleropages formosus TaxID=113540 RepID=A0A8C9T0M5_SCLFO
MSKQFLYSKSEADKYKFFMKATLLEQMKLDYIHIKQTKELTRDRVGTQEKYLRDLRKKYLQKKERYDSLSSLDEMKKKLEDLQHEMAWSLVWFYSFALCMWAYLKYVSALSQSTCLTSPHSAHPSREAEILERQSKISTLRQQLDRHENEGKELNRQITDKQQVLMKAKEESGKLRLEEKNIQASVESKQRRKSQLMASRSNRLRRFGNQFPELLMAIDNAHTEGRFLKKPIGPVGACISLKDPSLAVAVESCLRNFTKTFCCHSHKDEKVLEALMSRYFPRIYRPGIIVMPFADQVYNTAGRCVKHPEFPSVLDALVIPSPVIANCLIDMRSIETVLVIKDRVTARRVMQQGKPPRNCREAFTSEGDQVFADRYYSAESSGFHGLLGCSPALPLTQSLFFYITTLCHVNKKKNSEAEEELDRLKALMTETHSKHKEMKSEIEKLQEQAGSLPVRLMDNSKELETTARLICPERRPVERSIESVNAEMTCFRQRILEQQSQHGDQEQIIREYAEALKSYQEAANQVKDLKRFIDCLDNIMNDRLMRFKMMRRSIAVRCKLYFSNFLIKLNCSGSMIFDHTKETLSISVKPPGCEDDSVNDVRSLSGGERSFATVCFILALWEITESPFRCLDEFDVYMDMHNRRISMDLLVQLSERQYGRQFIFITPQNTRYF